MGLQPGGVGGCNSAALRQMPQGARMARDPTAPCASRITRTELGGLCLSPVDTSCPEKVPAVPWAAPRHSVPSPVPRVHRTDAESAKAGLGLPEDSRCIHLTPVQLRQTWRSLVAKLSLVTEGVRQGSWTPCQIGRGPRAPLRAASGSECGRVSRPRKNEGAPRGLSLRPAHLYWPC